MAPLTKRLVAPSPVMVSPLVSTGRAAVSVIVWPVNEAAKLMVSGVASASAWVMAERRVTVPAGGAAVSVMLLTVIVDSTQRSSKGSSRGRTKRNQGFRVDGRDFDSTAHLQ